MSINLEDHLDADHLAVLELVPGDLFDFSDLPAARARLDAFMALMPVPEIPNSVEIADHRVEAVDGHGVLVRVYRPAQRRDRSPGLYWIHGGGMVLGDVGMFVAETKGSLSSMQLRGTESAKIECARKFFESLNAKNGHVVKYDIVTDYSTLMDLVGQP